MNKIGWCDMTWNPVWGCHNHCEYCYARGIAKRFKRVIAENECNYRWYKMEIADSYTKRAFINMTEEIRNFKPTFLHSQFNKNLSVNSASILSCLFFNVSIAFFILITDSMYFLTG